MLLVLIIPATQAAREAARRVQCSSNFRQLGIAITSYHGDHNMYQSSMLIDAKQIARSSVAEHVFLLPYLENRVIYVSINIAFMDVESPEAPSTQNRTARRTLISTFVCPSDGEANLRNSYRFNRGRYHVRTGLPYDGPFSIGVMPSAATITDGLSGTAFASERIAGSFQGGSTGLKRDVRYPDMPAVMVASDNQLIQLCLTYEPALWMNVSGRYWFYAGFANTHYNHNGVPNDVRPSCYTGGLGIIDPGGLSPPRSFHNGCVNVLFGDGHLEAIRDSIQLNVWQSLGTYNAGD
nr:DUF1559 domain-containing protein [Singulisphaera sp. GP187]